MPSRTKRTLSLAIASVALVLFAASTTAAQPVAGWTDRDEVARTAHRLSERTGELYQVLRSARGYDHLVDDARQLYMSAERLHRNVEQGAPPQYVVSNYYDILQQLDRTRVALFGAHDAHHYPQVSHGWARVVGANELLAITLGVPGQAVCSPPGDYGYGYPHPPSAYPGGYRR